MAFKRCAELLEMDARELLELNQEQYRALSLSSVLEAGTKLLINEPEHVFDEYSHWTFPDDDPAKAEPSYMMARRLRPQRQP